MEWVGTMQLRVKRQRQNGKTYEYAQLVESYRRESDGMPMHRVVAHLGPRSAAEIENLRTAIRASRAGQHVVIRQAAPRGAVTRPRVLANLRYLDLAVLRALWQELGLTEILDEVLPGGGASVRPVEVVAPLVLQRCVDPGSKLYATQWFPRTALPELLGVAPTAFNNTRVHRTLDELDHAGPALMARLPRRYQEREGAFAAMFLDVTDTWFVGRGPAMAERAKTKEGRVERKIGIVLLCNERGYPLRWEVVKGRSHDSVTMGAMLRAVAGSSWVGEAPVVCDRAMGKTAQIVEMAATGLRFVTALTSTEFASYAGGIPHQEFARLQPTSDAPEELRHAVATAAACAQAAGLRQAEENLYVLDLGSVERPVEQQERSRQRTSEAVPAQAMRLCREMHESVQGHRFTSYAAAGRALGLGKGVALKYCSLRTLAEDVQRDILAGRADDCSIADLLALARRPDPEEQRTAFTSLAGARRAHGRRPRSPAPAPEAASAPPPLASLKVRVVAYFNPDLFVEQRVRAHHLTQEIQAAVATMNAALASPRSRQTRDQVAAAIDRLLRRHDLVAAFRVTIHEQIVSERKQLRIAVTLDEEEWTRRRRYDGFTVLVAHPLVPQGATDLCRLYRAKDVVEKDFQTIKSVVELRPIHHHDEGKVRAHVTICMLALLLVRALKQRLGGKHSAEAALEILEECRLNHYAGDPTIYGLTEATAEQKAILRQLRLAHLADDNVVAEGITPR
jgi:hypothetical protein